MSNGSHSSDNVLEHNCRPEWALWTCVAANVCGLTSTTLWFLVLLPQVYKNFRRKSVVGLSILWATANFTASLVNIFFVYLYASLPVYSSINAVYMPILEFTILVQFWLYNSEFSVKAKYCYAAGCAVLWGTIITVQLTARRFSEMQWVAITLWCVETFPQIVLNLKLRSTAGQSTRSAVIATIGKMTDFLATYGLVIPLQYVVMAYFSSSVAYINGIQIAWYFRKNSWAPGGPTVLVSDQDNGFIEGNNQTPDNESYGNVTMESEDVEYTPLCSGLIVRWRHPNLTRTSIVRGVVIGFLVSALALFLFGLVVVTDSGYSAMAPLSIASALSLAYIYYHTSAGQRLRQLCSNMCEKRPRQTMQ
ncbi:hypothetical protein KP79_PYT11311 [Mizuhopecten yessoensis]|uniref:PQ-loop repeat-containing protein 3 n=2 Tax=Mizuhopecten yessoensis TaxID=6573 RepID=A0A210R3Q3_MIZYE|nr:hypothetical protein KP79_PYT11311 [Mizuhopecten yessoensis]